LFDGNNMVQESYDMLSGTARWGDRILDNKKQFSFLKIKGCRKKLKDNSIEF